ncbi:MAG: hypothetical protein IPN08_04125 [Bacteroidales bacterium]|nr:hypothetical protein [Bacteroidales bacterium]
MKALRIQDIVHGSNNPITIKTNDAIERLIILKAPHVYKIDFLGGGSAYKSGLKDKYLILSTPDWEFGNGKTLDKKDLLRNKYPLNVVLMVDSTIKEYQLGPDDAGFNIFIEPVTISEEAQILQKYQEWKTNQTNK